MKKFLMAGIPILCLLLAGCAFSDKLPAIPGQPDTAATPIPSAIPDILPDSSPDGSETLLEEYLQEPDLLETRVREYGEDTGYMQMEAQMVVRILYPEGEVLALNRALADWAEDTVTYYRADAAETAEGTDSAELTADYDSYLVNGNWISVKITGWYDKPWLAHPEEFVSTFHADLEQNSLITLDTLLLPDARPSLEAMVIKDAGVLPEDADEHLLDNWILTAEGLEITLARGIYLPQSAGTVTCFYPYEVLENILNMTLIAPAAATPENPSPEADTDPETESQLSELPGYSDRPMVALTFDDGPSKHTDRLLDIFAEYGGKGTFFVVGNIVENHPATMERMAAEGHQIAGHSWDHRQLTKLPVGDLTDQIMATRAKIYELTGIDSTLLRPPYGSYNKTVKQVCADLGVVMANWSLDTLDWKYKDPDKIYETIMEDVKAGDIILCHDLHSTTVDAMEKVIPALIDAGYQLVTVSDLLCSEGKEPEPGTVYTKQ